jgi:hypothetical protein
MPPAVVNSTTGGINLNELVLPDKKNVLAMDQKIKDA